MSGKRKEDTKFPEAKLYLMIFGGSQAYQSQWQRDITEMEVNAVHTPSAAPVVAENHHLRPGGPP
jgi:hypothetical protein